MTENLNMRFPFSFFWFAKRRTVAGVALGAALALGAMVPQAWADDADATMNQVTAVADSGYGGSMPTYPAGSIDKRNMSKENLPSAPAGTPLCDQARLERAAIGTAVEPAVPQPDGYCALNACFDPATATYMAANGQVTVCR
ncbi:hypothetical protein E3E12_05950 [Formicincola oecophyllae]|uniref:Lectin-like protein BA14k n=1 Tax=Formicincola oecophyllae TaxID=2558361 RepID=A0A4Y6UB47_9PROT|nr:hypothetical protein [Formicincola oecophyllae]QDH13798.1 hypothetical protein E3E12_05950 [Formicincola oecophyllae]